MNPISPWTTTVQADLQKSAGFLEKNLLGFTFRLHNTGDSVWIVVQWPESGSVAFRAAFGLNSAFEIDGITEKETGAAIQLSTRLGHYQIEIIFPDSEKPLLHYTTSFKPTDTMIIPFWPRDIVPLTKEGNVENTAGKIHTSQVGARSGQLFFSMTRPKNGSVFYMQNLGALSKYCDAIQVVAGNTVGGTWPEIGYQLPVSTENPLPGGTEYIISDAFILMSELIPETEFDVAEQFLESLGTVYLQFPKPETKYYDWPEVSKKSLNDLITNKGCWTYADKNPYLNAYLCDYKTPPEIMVQLAVLFAISEYGLWAGKKFPVVDEIRAALPKFYDEKLKTISRWLPSQRGNLDGSEEQKLPMTMDSWYLHHPLMNLSKLALDGDKKSEKLLMDSVEYAIKVAHHFKYRWPVFYKMDTLETLKEETSPGMGGEKDVAGGYTHLMINLYKLTEEKRYLNEAVKAAKSLEELGLDIFYQANNTAFSALAMLRIYKETKDEKYLKLSNLCLAGIMKNVQLWESDYGYGKNFPNFFGVFPLNDAPYRAAYEEMEVYTALNDYIKEADEMDAPILPSLKLLLPEFVKYSINRIMYYYPTMLPQEILADQVKTGELDSNLWIPLEDIYDGWEKNGQIGQEVYGAGVGFGVAPRQYKRIKGESFQFYCDYPIANFKLSNYKSASFRTLGDSRLECRLQIVSELKIKKTTFTVITGSGKEEREIQAIKNSDHIIEFVATGSQAIKIKWH